MKVNKKGHSPAEFEASALFAEAALSHKFYSGMFVSSSQIICKTEEVSL